VGGSIGSLAFSPDGHRLTSAFFNGTVTFWDATPLPEKPWPPGDRRGDRCQRRRPERSTLLAAGFVVGNCLAQPELRPFPKYSNLLWRSYQTTQLWRTASGSSEIPRRFVTHDFHAENSSVLCESLSIGRWPAKWP